ncbi:MAG: hypothetical protein VR72_09775 [Clostridiaceae bacterium BRH_c20a]|nr:MAG: hypothetical protein VR72_09775 [Clostridiaceae bacterium BRH_c20a]
MIKLASSAAGESTVFPNSIAEAKSIIMEANKKKIAIYPLGGGSKIQQILPEIQDGIILSTKNLNKVIEYRPDNMSIEVEAGMRIEELSTFLAADNLFFPIYNNSPGETVGGLVASNSWGKKKYMYKSTRHYVLGLEFISPSGEVVKVGGRTIKNVSGYDISQLLAGSWGHFGFITKVTLRLKPKPQTKLTMECKLSSIEAIKRIIPKIISRGYRLSLLCYKSSGTEMLLQIELEGLKDIIDIQSAELAKEFGFYKTDIPLKVQEKMLFNVVLDLDNYLNGLDILQKWSGANNFPYDLQGIATNGTFEFNISGEPYSEHIKELSCSINNIGGTLYYQNNAITNTDQQSYRKLLLNIKKKIDSNMIFMASSKLLKE